MVYIDAEELKYMPYVATWIQGLTASLGLAEELKTYLLNLFETNVEDCLTFVKKHCSVGMNQVRSSQTVILNRDDHCLFVCCTVLITGRHK